MPLKLPVLPASMQPYAYCLKYPLHKLIPSGYLGSPGFTSYGEIFHPDNDTDESFKHLSVICRFIYEPLAKIWEGQVLVQDADDMVYSLRKPLTRNTWEELVDVYETLDYIAPEKLMAFFIDLGFK